jgi:hypothetical protein
MYCIVPVHHELYRFALIRKLLRPTPTDQVDKFRCKPLSFPFVDC